MPTEQKTADGVVCVEGMQLWQPGAPPTLSGEYIAPMSEHWTGCTHSCALMLSDGTVNPHGHPMCLFSSESAAASGHGAEAARRLAALKDEVIRQEQEIAKLTGK